MPDSDVTKNERDTLLKIQTILYSTEVSDFISSYVKHNSDVNLF
jgi:hypothetical protein